MPEFQITTELPCDVAEFSRRQLTMAGVNAELAPIVQMTAPAQWRRRPIVEWPCRETIFTSTILLFGVLPIDRHRFRMLDVGTDGFHERSTSLMMRAWGHQRDVEPTAAGIRVVDTVRYEMRLRLLGRLFRPLYEAIFRHRRRKLRKRFGMDESGGGQAAVDHERRAGDETGVI